MKKLITLLTICLLAVSAWGDVSVVETFGDIRETGVINPATQNFDLTFCQWEGCRIRKNGRYENNNGTMGADWIKISSDTIDAIWMAKDNDNVRYIRTTNLTGGIKNVSTRFAQFGKEKDNNNVTATLTMKISAGEDEQMYTLSGTNMGKENGGCSWNYPFNLKKDGQLKFENVSTGGSTSRRILLGHIVLTPYLMYTQKVANIDLNGGEYTHPIINNTEDESGVLTFESSTHGVATVNNSGVVTPVSVGNTTITATYTWDETHSVTASYTLYVTNNIKETFSNATPASVTTAEGSPWSSDYFFGWQAKLARRGSDDKMGTAQCTWLATNGANQASLTTTDLEGGIKSVYFPYAQYSGEAANYLKLEVRTLNDNGQTISSVEKTRGKGSNCGNNKATGLSFYWESNCAQNAQLQIINTSVNRSDNGNPASNARWLVGDVVITPYLLYTTKVVTLDTRHSGTYKNNDLIDNTGGGVSYESNNEAVANVNGTGDVTIVGPGVATITATWGSVSTSYTLYVDDVITEDYSKAPTDDVVANERLSFDGNNFTWWYRNARSQTTDKLRNNDRGFWMSRGSGSSCYLESETEGGIKKVDFNWRQWTKDEHGFHFVMQIMTKDDAVLDEVSFTGAADYWNNDQSYSKILSIRENKSKFKINNLSTSDGTTVKGKLLVGPITITPYLLYTRKSVSVKLSDDTYTHPIINNTASETGSLAFTSSNSAVATVNAYGEVTLVAPGAAVITATFTWEDGEYVSTSYALSVVENIALVEDYQTRSEQADGDGHSFVGNYATWWYRNASNINRQLHDGSNAFWLSHTIKDISNTSAYLECGRGDDLQEGGIKNVSFKWHQFGNGSNQTIKLQVKINNTVKETIEEEGGDANCALATTDQEYNSSADVYSKTNAKLTIANVSYKTGDASTNAQGRVIIGPITITPYLFYLDKVAHVAPGERYVHPLLNNTDNEGSITYSISPAGVATINSKTGQIRAIGEGTATVKATWSEGAYTTYTLRVRVILNDDGEGNATKLESFGGQTVDVQLANRTIRTGGYNTLCLPFAMSEAQIGEALPGAKVYNFTNAYLGADNLDIRFEKVNAMEAGKPYLVTVPADVENPVFEGVTISDTEVQTVEGGSINFIGTYEPMSLPTSALYVVGNELRRNSTTANVSTNAFRAYFDVPAGSPALAPSVRMRIVTHTDHATGMEQINQAPQTNVQKVIRDGQLYIIYEGRMYDVRGIRVK